MNPRPFVHLAVLAAALAQLSCATTGLTPLPHSQPAERIGLAPEYRVFYDALKDDGDWVYVQPYGYVFRPNVNFITWRPYEDGFWVPSDLYGWVWISAESFGWATYHYGQWLYDRYYGWVWTPGLGRGRGHRGGADGREAGEGSARDRRSHAPRRRGGRARHAPAGRARRAPAREPRDRPPRAALAGGRGEAGGAGEGSARGARHRAG